jgi:hypothetical protein
VGFSGGELKTPIGVGPVKVNHPDGGVFVEVEPDGTVMAAGYGGGMSGRAPTAPAEPAHKAVFFLAGLAAFIKGLLMLFH